MRVCAQTLCAYMIVVQLVCPVRKQEKKKSLGKVGKGPVMVKEHQDWPVAHLGSFNLF